ncbi:hypothetical protein LTR91_006117 [Friedmanniomyces endolithicus]|uniref:Uncharacterized protein n=2 Tax=Friedmanniomyces endolithicus TaxID=329885 RepID=A0AAN6J2E3_9PEZI|nr:hypothetical protein LTR35_012861 [Friedmanniomyces endolithicus]KAK0308564.1 hypothetical protein LTR82_015502 [Friedmanniomyces endolithicus]KAK0924454.1 hypothetical protein LTR57_005974 [Friedmanniomyces endolithicus]KAK0988954.1 hypothetical protein LTR54_012529 [Friedmanniomyces endolithicus]KAK0994461.1 hypothetical protein LTS01_007181 [Friedmanniomyces endolithicus]
MKMLRTKMSDWLRNILSCCDREDEEEERPALQISRPTNFRREEIKLPGLDPEQQRWIREKAIADAGRMYEHLSPLRSSPSGQFAADPRSHRITTATLPSYEQFTTPVPAAPPIPTPGAPPTTSSVRRTSVGSHALDRVRAHGRKISSSLSKPLGGYQTLGVPRGEHGAPYEMRALIDEEGPPRRGKGSGEGYSVAGSEEEGVRDHGEGGKF